MSMNPAMFLILSAGAAPASGASSPPAPAPSAVTTGAERMRWAASTCREGGGVESREWVVWGKENESGYAKGVHSGTRAEGGPGVGTGSVAAPKCGVGGMQEV